MAHGDDPPPVRPTSPTRSPPARSSSGRRRSSRSWSRTRIDAGATRIAITVELGGKKLIRVEDDGEGMDAGGRAAGDRAARDQQDPPRRRSRRRSRRSGSAARRCRQHRLGLALHAAHARARQRERHRDPGQRRRPSRRSREVGAPEGTSIEVGDLFYNLPARRKFLKSDAAESAQVSRLVTQLALGYPEVGFTLTSGGRTAARVSAGGIACAIASIRCTASAPI